MLYLRFIIIFLYKKIQIKIWLAKNQDQAEHGPCLSPTSAIKSDGNQPHPIYNRKPTSRLKQWAAKSKNLAKSALYETQ